MTTLFGKRCESFWFPKHHWSKWEEEHNHPVFAWDKRTGTLFIYKRVCNSCGLIQRKKEQIEA